MSQSRSDQRFVGVVDQSSIAQKVSDQLDGQIKKGLIDFESADSGSGKGPTRLMASTISDQIVLDTKIGNINHSNKIQLNRTVHHSSDCQFGSEIVVNE